MGLRGKRHMDTKVVDYEKVTREYLYKINKKNKDIDTEINSRYKEVKSISHQISILQKKMKECSFELDVLKEIKTSQKTFIEIDKKIESYIKGLENQNILNVWNVSYSHDNDKFSTTMYSIKNATYSGIIIKNYNKKNDYCKINFEIHLSPILLNLVKEHKKLFLNIEDLKIIEDGKVLFNENETEIYIESLKVKYKRFFDKERASLLKNFKDTKGIKYNAEDFIFYDEMLIDGFEIIENNEVVENKNNEEDIIF